MIGAGAVWAVLIRPWLWWTAVVQVVRLCPRGWWRSAPFLPVPRRDYLEFRWVTQYGGDPGDGPLRVRSRDVVDYLHWCRAWNSQRNRSTVR